MNREQIIQTFVALGERLAHFGSEPISHQAMTRAMEANSWFSEEEIRHAINALCTQMLNREHLLRWLDDYPSLPATTPRNILVVMAGNIPLVGFFDLLCVVASGNRCLVKPSSKDRALMQYIIDQLIEIEPQVMIELFDGQQTPDAVIATGSDNAVRHFRAKYGSLPLLLRGSRGSVAILNGTESANELNKLCEDIYIYSGLGCRNISLIFVPKEYNTSNLEKTLRTYRITNSGYLNNYRQRRAILTMSGVAHADLGHSLLVEECAFPTAISQINVTHYESFEEVCEWLSQHNEEIQCVACNNAELISLHTTHCATLLRSIPLGHTQHPTLTDYPDALDVMKWVENLN